MKKLLRAAICTLAGFLLMAVRATTVVPPTFEEMVDRADLIFRGQVIGSRGEWRSAQGNRAIFTLVEFQTEEVLKGSAGKVVTLQFLGGTVGDVTMDVSGVPRFSVGDHVFLFVEGNGVQFCPVVGVFHGKFGLRKDQSTGRELLVMYNGKPLLDVAQIGAGDGAEFTPKRAKPFVAAAGREPLLVDAFKAKVVAHLGRRPDQK